MLVDKGVDKIVDERIVFSILFDLYNIVPTIMLYYVLVYECVLVQMLSARSGVLSFNRLSNHLFPTVHMQSFCCGSSGPLASVPVLAQT